MFPFMCRSKGKSFVINSSYHTYISFILSPLPSNITYPCWLATSYSCPSFIVLVWSYHWWFKYPFVLMPMWEWPYNNPWYILQYYHNYCFREWNTCPEWAFPPFPSSHLMTSGYLYHQKWLLDLNGYHYCWSNLHRYDAMSIGDNSSCNDDGYCRNPTLREVWGRHSHSRKWEKFKTWLQGSKHSALKCSLYRWKGLKV